ncbi:hypothetical protein NZD88_10970 [Chryseobacterium antibioticum]|uniref:Lipoprotein n=1 Tax=Chryseobacterium pyrolae TaxID=2987481 RepID=A0ABT2IHF8_9FLAO|nr:hypothetical protein [Chryseobacterium pyrolae]MCT2408061.1 hypothetical protein [Chryseobacterium pyrolae]
MLYLFLISCKTHDENKKHPTEKPTTENVKLSESKFLGEFSAAVETEETTSGTANITYHFVIKNDVAILTTSTYHEPVRCNGNYKAIVNDDMLELYYSGNEENCKSQNASFKIKKENNSYFVQGLGGETTFNEWIELSKLK